MNKLNPFVVAPGGAYGLNIAFTPASSGSFADALILTSNAGNTLTTSSINLSGSGMDGYFTPVMPTGLPYTILINDITIDGNALTPGDEIGVFEYDANTENDLCVGSFIYTDENEDIFQIIAWEADPELGLSGFTSGSDIIIKWKISLLARHERLVPESTCWTCGV